MFKGKNLLFLLSLILLTSSLTFSKGKLKDREEIDAKYKWNLNDIYNSWEEWEADLAKMKGMMDEIAGLKGTLNSSEAVLDIMKKDDALGQVLYKVYRYPGLARELDNRNPLYIQKLGLVQAAYAGFGTATAWINPELLQIPEETMQKWIDENDELKVYAFSIMDLYRQQKHVHTEDKERLLSYFSTFNGSPDGIYEQLSTADIQFPEVVLSTGDTITATAGNYSHTLATNTNQDDRRKAFEAHYSAYVKNKSTYAAIYNSVCQRDWANAQARNYNSTLEASLDGNNIPVEVYTNLISTVKENTAPLKKYIQLRKKLLGLEEYHSYDGSIPIIDFKKTYQYETAQKNVYESVAPLGDEYQAKMKIALNDGWVDVFETEGKSSGAFSANVYGVHPYMLMNYNETIDNMFTLGHELGHTLHSMLANENQPFATSNYTIFVAEVASTFNEALLLDYLYDRTDDPVERIALLQQSISNLTGTFFFQSLLADFELSAHKMVEQGQPLTAETLDKMMNDLYLTYFGEEEIVDEYLPTVWARISHLYGAPYYVFQYATCFASSAQLYNDVIKNPKGDKEEAVESYLNLLKSGGNDYPMTQLKKAGVDLTQPEPVLAVVKQMNDLVNKLEVEINKLDK